MFEKICIILLIGRVCVPIIPEECEHFNPMTVPTSSSLYNEIIDYDRRHVKNDGKRNLRGNYLKEIIKFK